jgi:hypothetical protein
VPNARRPQRSETALREAEVLHVLFDEPDLVYAINRRLRELAADDPDLQRGPLRALDADDFSRSDYRAIMVAFQAALRQDEREPFDYLQAALDDSLRATLDEIMTHALDALRPHLRHGLGADLTVHLRRGKSTVDARSKVIENVLYLRHQRLKRDLGDRNALMLDGAYSSDVKELSSLPRAILLIENELEKQARTQY